MNLPASSAAPGSTQEAAELLRESASIVRVAGAGTKSEWGSPPRQVGLTVQTKGLNGIVEHVAGDLIVVVRAGTPMAQLQAELAGSGQQLALDSPYPQATVGGTVAANTSGPRRMAYGTVRDLLIGVTIVRPDGVIARAGGKVVKNVAGYDLGKLFTGSYGTLGLITECAFRLHPLPVTSTFVRCRPADPAAAAALIRSSQLVASAIEVDAAPGGEIELAVLFEGAPARAQAAARLLGGEVTDVMPPWWGRYPWQPGEIGLKLTGALSQLSTLLALRGIHLRGSLGVGVLYAGAAGAAAAEAVEDARRAAHAAGGHAVVLTAPPELRDQLDLWGPVPGLELMRRVKEQFDPRGRFAPGSFAGGI